MCSPPRHGGWPQILAFGDWRPSLHASGYIFLISTRSTKKAPGTFPTFAGLRAAMQEEAILLFTDLFQNDGSVLAIFDGDHTFLNEPLAKHYGIPGVNGPGWRRVDGVKKYGRGGILGLAATLAKQSGASRTSPILRGNWVAEVLLGDKLPRPRRTFRSFLTTRPPRKGSPCASLSKGIQATHAVPVATCASTPSATRSKRTTRSAAGAIAIWAIGRSIRRHGCATAPRSMDTKDCAITSRRHGAKP